MTKWDRSGRMIYTYGGPAKQRPVDHDWAWIPPAPRPWKTKLLRAALTAFAGVLLTGAWAYSLVWYSETPWMVLPMFGLFWGVSYEVSRGIR